MSQALLLTVCNRIRPILILFGLFLTLNACKPDQRMIEIEVKSLDDNQDPIAWADILLENEKIGETDQFGSFKKKILLPGDQLIRIEVRKNSDQFYYAPHFQNLSLKESSGDRVAVKAILYSVPKGRFEAEDDSSQALVEAAKTNPPPVKIENESTAKDSLLEVQTKGEVEQATTLQAKESEADQVLDDQKSSTLPQALPIADQEPSDLSSAKPSSERESTAESYKITVYGFHKSQPIEGLQLFYGHASEGQMKPACTTEKSGRCSFSVEPSTETIRILAKKQGFRTQQRDLNIQSDQRLRFQLRSGHSIDVFAINRRYGYNRGLPDIEVSINGHSVGHTDAFGHYSHFYEGEKGDLLEVSLRSKDYLPHHFSTDYVVAGPMSLVKYFNPETPHPVRLSYLPVQAAGRMETKTLSKFGGDLDRYLAQALQKSFRKTKAMQLVKPELLKENQKAGWSLSQAAKDGWQDTSLKARIDALIIPTLILQKPLGFELSVVDASGHTLIASKEALVSYSDRNAIENAVQTLVKRIEQRFPFEGTITAMDDEGVTINLGTKHGLPLKTGDYFEVWGLQSDRFGQSKALAKIGLLNLRQLQQNKSLAHVKESAPRSVIDIGDQVILTSNHQPAQKTVQIRVGHTDNNQPIAQANIYFQGEWLGSTGSDGILKLSKKNFQGKGLLSAIKYGYRDFTREIDLTALHRLEVKMEREAAYINIDSVPSGAMVYIDQKPVGKTPFAKPVSVPSGFVKIELRAGPNFKTYSQVFEMREGTLDLSSDRSIQLESDLFKEAMQTFDNGDIEGALTQLKAIPNQHSDYLRAQHKAGEIYLTILNEPAAAAAAFHQVTSEKSVQSFIDKRFIGTHINEGMALFLSGKRLMKESPDSAVAHFRKAVEVLQNVEPQLRHINPMEHADAVHNLKFYKALSLHEIWNVTRDPSSLALANKSWAEYLDQTARSSQSKQANSLLEEAKIYFKQTEASMRQYEHSQRETM